MIAIREREGGVTIACHVLPRAGRDEIRGERGGALLVALAVPPIEGRANEALIRLIAAAAKVPPSRVSILIGAHSRKKTIFIQGLAMSVARPLFERLVNRKS